MLQGWGYDWGVHFYNGIYTTTHQNPCQVLEKWPATCHGLNTTLFCWWPVKPMPVSRRWLTKPPCGLFACTCSWRLQERKAAVLRLELKPARRHAQTLGTAPTTRFHKHYSVSPTSFSEQTQPHCCFKAPVSPLRTESPDALHGCLLSFYLSWIIQVENWTFSPTSSLKYQLYQLNFPESCNSRFGGWSR